MKNLKYHFLFFFSVSFLTSLVFPWSQEHQFSQVMNYEGSSDLIDLRYRMGPVLASPVKLYIIWYGHWGVNHQSTIKDFIYSLTASSPSPSVADWWQTVRLYTDQSGSNVTEEIVLSGESYDTNYSHGRYLSRLSMQSIIKSAVNSRPEGLPLNPYNGLYLVLTSGDVQVQDFCRAVCGFHYFTFPHIVGVTVPYAWVGYSGTQCPGMCAYPFAWPGYSGKPPPNTKNGGNNIMKAPNGDPAVDGMISVIAHELAEVSSNPLINAWYAGDDPTNPNEVADLCLGVYGTGAGGGYVGKVFKDNWGIGFNVNGVKGRRFMVQWIWNLEKKRCSGPNAKD